jgi:uncharacterized protein YabN with tetrapyrrole methylase and pyrophosphatase domain
MNKFFELISIIERLLGPDGCPWDKEQTLQSLRSSLLEETCELIEAIDLNDNAHILEELGDLIFNAVFIAMVAEKEDRFKWDEVLTEINSKLIRRHPHIFGDVTVQNVEQVLVQWEKIKKEEKGKRHRQSMWDDIPKNLPALSRAQKILNKIAKTQPRALPILSEQIHIENEQQLGQLLISIVSQAHQKGLDAEHALRAALTQLEAKWRESEKKSQAS